jgi:hypothetical protein
MKIKCELYCRSNSSFLQQIYTGFRLLEQQRKIELSYRINKNQLVDIVDHVHEHVQLLVQVNDTKLLLFDNGDFGEINEECLSKLDIQFKRSFSAKTVGPELAYKKVFPLGLAYPVYEKYPSRFSLNRMLLDESAVHMAKSFVKTFLSSCSSFFPRLFRLHTDNCYANPEPSLPSRVIFMTRLYDPSTTKPKYRSFVEAINNTRVNIIRKLRQEFGSHFQGGLALDDYSSRYFTDCLLTDARLSIYGNYIRLMRQYPIGIATTGLHGSIGWKFAEYVAFSHAIVSEKLHFEAPGLEAGKHYLEFTSADECVDAVSTLMDDKDLRAQMMERNHEYYQIYLRPDRLVWNALSIALEH